ncbi:Hint domain-containing protein [bacterium]|nr:Hint domain-containing protein [bacterium]
MVFLWKQLGLDIDGEAANDNSGYSVSLSEDGSRVAIGATGNDGKGTTSGQVRVYQLINGTTWTQLGQDIDGEAANDYSGRSVSLSTDGSRVAIGATGNDGNVNISGHVRVYQLINGTTWQQLGQDIDGEAANDNSGYSVSLSADGSRVAIGATGNDGTGKPYSGQVRVYKFENQQEQTSLTITTTPLGPYTVGETFTVTVETNSDATISYSSSSEIEYVSQDGKSSVWKAVGVGPATITVQQPATPVYTAAVATEEITVVPLINDVSGGPTKLSILIGGTGFKGVTKVTINGTTDLTSNSFSINSDGTSITAILPSGDLVSSVSVSDRVVTSDTFVLETPIYPTCFPAGTPILTDQGIVPIEKISPNVHTINNKLIVAVTQTITNEHTLVCIEKNALANNVPSEDTIISRCHTILYNGKMVQAKHLLKLLKNKKKVYSVKYNKELLYNILMEKHQQMSVNNMMVETLDPENIIAKLYSNNCNQSAKHNIIVQINNCMKRNDFKKCQTICDKMK